MDIKKGVYYTDNSDLLIELHTIYYRAEEYMKCKASLIDKYRGQILETKTYKIYYRNIKHWKLLA